MWTYNSKTNMKIVIVGINKGLLYLFIEPQGEQLEKEHVSIYSWDIFKSVSLF